MVYRTFVLMFFVVGLVACDSEGINGGLPVPEAPPRELDANQLALGENVYQTNCASCHGAQGQGMAEWRKRGADGFYPPPPLNGSAHAWHHSTEVLKDVIRNGSPGGKGNMPAWDGKLTDREMDAVIIWFQSKWPKPVYDAWFEMQQRGR